MKRAWWGLTATLALAGMSCGGPALPEGPVLRTPNAAELPRMWVISVGVSKYIASGFELKYADADAKAIDQIFAEPRGPVPEGRRTLLVNEQVNRASVLGALKEVGNRSAKNDVIVFFMAAHGIKREGEPFYFMAHDTDPANLMATGIRDGEVIETLKGANAKKHVVLIDACHAGGYGLDASLRAVRAEATTELVRGFQSVGSGTGVLAAAAPSQFSEENERWGGGHGVFTYHLVDGLRQGLVDENKDGVATLRELYDYVYVRVKKDRGGLQHPDFKGEGEIPLMAYDWKPELSPPPKKCKSLDEKCVVKSDTVAKVKSAGLQFIPPTKWIYAQTETYSIMASSDKPTGAVLAIGSYTPNKDAKKNDAARDAAFADLLKALGATLPKNYKVAWKKPEAPLDANGLKMGVWLAVDVERSGLKDTKGNMPIVHAPIDAAHNMIAVGFALGDDEKGIEAIQNVLVTIKPDA